MTARDVTERAAWLALATVPGVGEHLLSRLVGHYGGSANVLAAAASGQLARDRQVGRLRALAPEVPARIAAVTPDAAESLLERHRLWALTPLDAGYPSRLRVLDPPPAVLYGWGDPAALVTPRAVALVGTRLATPEAFRIGEWASRALDSTTTTSVPTCAPVPRTRRRRD